MEREEYTKNAEILSENLTELVEIVEQHVNKFLMLIPNLTYAEMNTLLRMINYNNTTSERRKLLEVIKLYLEKNMYEQKILS